MPQLDPMVMILALVAVVALAAAVIIASSLRAGRAQADAERQALTRVLEGLVQNQSSLGGRLSQLAESQATAVGELGRRLDEGLQQASHRQANTLHDLRERLAVIDAAQKNITELSVQVVGLQDILSNKQARGAFGEIQLIDLVKNALPPSAYEFQAPLGDGRRVDCLLTLPNPPGPIAIDAKFPLESYHAVRQAKTDAERQAAARGFAAAILKHVKDIADRYIVPGETAESALMFLPSEAVYAELHASFPEVVERSYRAKVWIVSPTTLMATLNTVRAVLKDAQMREQAGLIQKEVRLLTDDINRLDERVGQLGRHFDQAVEDVRQIRISTDKVAKRADRIEAMELGEGAAVTVEAKTALPAG